MSSKPVLWITRKLSEKTEIRAAQSYDLILNPEDSINNSEKIIEISHKVDGIMPCHSEIFHADVVSQLGNKTRIIANYSVGTDHCDLEALKAKGIIVTNTPDVLSDATAEIAILLLLGAARRAPEGDRMVREKRWSTWSPSFMVGHQVSGKRLGIVGMGKVGQVVAKRARGFDMEVHYYNRNQLQPELENGAVFHPNLESLLKVSQFLTLHCPSTPESKGMMNIDTFGMLPDGAILVNCARGALVDEKAMMAALKSGKLPPPGWIVLPGNLVVILNFLISTIFLCCLISAAQPLRPGTQWVLGRWIISMHFSRVKNPKIVLRNTRKFQVSS